MSKMPSQIDSLRRVGFVGHDGLAAGFVARLKAAGFEVAESSISTPRNKAQMKGLAQVVSAENLIITLFESPQEIEEMYLGSGGVLANVKPGSYLIDLSLNTPRFARELHALASVHDCYFVEAPFAAHDSTAGLADDCAAAPPAKTIAKTAVDATGAIADDAMASAIKDGKVRLFVGGEPSILKQVQPLLEIISPQVLVVGLPGAGSSARLAAAISQASALMGLVETITFALNSNIDRACINALFASDPHVPPSMVRLASEILNEHFDSGSPLERFFHDLTIAIDAADELELAFPVLETTHQLYDLLMMVGGSSKALQALALMYREEEFCVKQGLNWALAQRAMDIYDQANGFDFDTSDDDCDDPGCDCHNHRHSHFHSSYDTNRRLFFEDADDEDEDGFPRMGGYFSSN